MRNVKFWVLLLVLGLSGKSLLAQELLSEPELEKKPIYHRLDQAYKARDKVYRLELRGSGGYYGQVDQIPERIDTLYNLQYLRVSGEALRQVPTRLVNLRRLQKLFLSNNRLEFFPDTLFYLPELRHLDLSHNMLSRLSEKIVHLQKLEFLYLDANPQLQDIPWEALKRLPQLKVLGLRQVPASRERLESLRLALPQVDIQF